MMLIEFTHGYTGQKISIFADKIVSVLDTVKGCSIETNNSKYEVEESYEEVKEKVSVRSCES